uniref:Chemokine interleukin-8-like domain-containing protein n=1 Tax=Gopherus evgoodei TaxID=1825980 RepID=A0A8C4VT32_9SAUR
RHFGPDPKHSEVSGNFPTDFNGCWIRHFVSNNDFSSNSLGKMEVIPKSSSCDHVEIIATLKPTGEQRCLNPNSKWVRKMVTALVKKR